VPWLSEHLILRRAEIAEARRKVTEAELRARINELPPVRVFALTGPTERPAVIAEIKFRSPSRGALRSHSDVEFVAEGYHRAGAAALSVLVDAQGFGGELAFLGRARRSCPLPLLAKGFFLEPYDLLAVRAAGADAALLIARALARGELEQMLKIARELGLVTLLELHDEADLVKIEGLEPDLLGVNHRNLETLELDANLSARLAPRLPASRCRVAESGLRSATDVRRMAALGYHAVLVGTAFMSLPDPGQGLANLLEELHGRH
jgi:indole-3-glycerol phosphate synthase